MTQRLEPPEAAALFIETYFPDCRAALLAGSVVRGQATVTSDLDIVVFDDRIISSYRESLVAFGWPVEYLSTISNRISNFLKATEKTQNQACRAWSAKAWC